MKREDQVLLIIQLIKQQRQRNPDGKDEMILNKVRTICWNLIESNDLSRDVVQLSLAAVFGKEQSAYEKAIRTSAITQFRKQEEQNKKEQERQKALQKEKEARERTSRENYDPCGCSFHSCRSGGC